MISQRTYTTSVSCKSNIGEVYCIKSDEFFRKFKGNVESWKVLGLMALVKEKVITEKVKRVRSLMRKCYSSTAA